ncbi:MAG TPA: hypothetical protein IAC79_03270 [Candidatus Spyradenecus faecavium]|uniref:Carbohydrate-binding domain-containing protein n=1 Tax=Candidatus Spyradenecus faecavium TaxID=2840947 RepID=A0A9D1T2E2_9BACT|nr:hypothetical protein [Candidatus Spyradenecus faecavium]
MHTFARLAAVAALTLLAGTAPAAPTYLLQRTAGPIAVDGVLDEPTWAKAAPASPLRDLSGGPSDYAADIRMAYDDACLYVAARLPAKRLRATLTERDSVIYRDDDFEVFIDPFARGRDYLELEINQLGTVWDLFLTAPYRDPECLALHDWDIKGLKTAVTLQGTLNDDTDDQGWCVEIAWPWASIVGHSNHPRAGTPPPPGAEMRMNFSRVDHPAPGDERNTVWAPTRQATIHAPEHWGRVRLSANPVGTPEAFPPTVGLWVHADNPDLSPADLRAWKAAGVTTLILGGADANIAKVARWADAEGLRAVAWLWALNRPDDPVALAHPDWHAVSLEGKSTFRPEDRPFVAYYQFLCPTHPEVRAYLADKARALAALPGVDAVQLDYIRLPDVVLPKALWPTYGLDMSTLLPPYDFCYCPRCKAAFGKEPDPADPAWADFRLTQVAAVANTVADAVRAAGKPCGAAVFPTPRLAAKMVYQDWARFRLDFALPMDYASFYDEGDPWVLDRLREAQAAVGGAFPILPGLHIPDFYDRPGDLRALIQAILKANPAGFCLFSDSELRRFRDRHPDAPLLP